MRFAAFALFLLAAGTVGAQPAPPGPPPQRPHRPMDGPAGKWWDRPEMVKRLEITPEQQKQIEAVFQQSRPHLIDLRANLEKEEVQMGDFMRGPQLDDAKILPAIDRIAQARAELEKANARLMLAVRHALTPEQWRKLNDDDLRPRREGPPPAERRGPPRDPPPPREE